MDFLWSMTLERMGMLGMDMLYSKIFLQQRKGGLFSSLPKSAKCSN